MEIPGLASIFFGPLARLLRLRREQRKPHHTRRARPAIQFQPLEPRVLLSADLIGTVQWDPGAAALFPDADAEAAVLVQNIGDRSAKSVKVSVYASADEVLDASDVLLGTDHTRGKLRPGAAQEVRVDLDFDEDLRPGEYQLLALVDSRDKVRESDESNNLALGPVFDFGWIFGDLPGCEGSDTLTFRDADGTKVTLRLDGPGVGELTWDGSGWDLQLTGTDGRSELSILTNRGGDGRFAIDDIHVAGSLDALFAPKTDLTGILAIDGRLDRGLVIGSATDAIIAVPSIGASKDHWHDRWSGHDRGHGRHDRHGDRDSGVTGIAVLGNLENSQILVGANLGADGQPGGEGDDADQFGSGRLGNLLIAGSMLSSAVRVGQDPVDGIFDNGDDVLEYGSIRSITIVGEMSDDSRVVAAGLPRYAFVDRHFVKTAVDPRFIDELGDEVAPGVTIDQAAGQADPTNESPIEFTVLFSEEVFGFGAEDIDFSGSTVGGELVASVMGSGASYTVSVSGMTSSGLVVASIGAGAAADAAGNLSEASTSSDNTVTLSVGADNDAPVAGDDAFSTAEDVARLITAAELL
ncbi:MAG: Ig-like domain-containing protein, partial [Betaproteobacteria bacterium]|nr:Ig-like domain-containing protein [Betaproteobacteria bacterium]